MTYCMNHQTQLVVTHVVGLIDARLVTDMIFTGLFLRMGAHFQRLLAQVRQVVSCKLEVIRAQDLPRARADACRFYSEELSRFVIDNCEHGSDEHEMRFQGKRTNAKAASERALLVRQAFVDTMNAFPLGGRLVHICHGCCKSRRESIEKVCEAIDKASLFWLTMVCLLFIVLFIMSTLVLLASFLCFGFVLLKKERQ